MPTGCWLILRAATNCGLDHTTPYIQGETGQTRPGNLGPLSRVTHRARTFGGWKLEQPTPGVFHWTSPAGYRYLVTANGTTRIHVPETEAEDETGSEADPAKADAEATQAGAEAETQAQPLVKTEPPAQAELSDEPEPLEEAS